MVNIEDVRSQLEARLDELSAKVHEIDRTLREPDSADSEERAVENEDEEVLEDMGNASLDEIASIHAALERMDLGTYGACTLCHETIDERRLEALPFAARCMACVTES
jgi:DnaK suppressor protein